MSKYTIHTHAQRPELIEQLSIDQWPEFMLHSKVAIEHYPYMYEHYTDFQFYLCNEEDIVVGDGVCIPIKWDGTLEDLPDGWDAALIAGVNGHKTGQKPTTLCALAATVSSKYVGQGISTEIIGAMKKIAAQHDLKNLLAPVRPSLKSLYPLTPIENYVRWKRDDGMLFDPWLRVHERQHAKILKLAPQSMTITGTVKQWQEWTKLTFPESGSYVVRGALAPLNIDCEKDEGVYIEPNLWVLHDF